jgi:hypothetical protein
MNRMLLVFAMMATSIGTATAPSAQTAIAGDQTPFMFQFEQTASPRGVAIEGWVTNTLSGRITNVRVQVDSMDANGALIASASGWVLGDVAGGGRGYFYVPISAQAAAYRATVQGFDEVTPAASLPQAP